VSQVASTGNARRTDDSRRGSSAGTAPAQNPAAHRLRDALARLDLVVVVDQFMTPTAELAHFVLPAKTLFEEEDLVTAYWHPYLQWRARILPPPAEVRPESDVWRALCERFGYGTSYFPADRESFLRALLPDGCGFTLDDLKERPLDLSGNGDVAFVDRRFPTPSGKVEFASGEASAMWGVGPVPDYAPLGEAPSRRRAPVPAAAAVVQDARPHPLAVRQPRLGARRRAAARPRHPSRRCAGARHRGGVASGRVERAGPDRADGAPHAGHPSGRGARAGRLVPRGDPDVNALPPRASPT
jgi:hypothetical protein